MVEKFGNFDACLFILPRFFFEYVLWYHAIAHICINECQVTVSNDEISFIFVGDKQNIQGVQFRHYVDADTEME